MRKARHESLHVRSGGELFWLLFLLEVVIDE